MKKPTQKSRSESNQKQEAVVAAANNHDNEVKIVTAEMVDEVVHEANRIVERNIESRMEFFSGPTPHPDQLRQYKEIHPESPAIIFNEFRENGAQARRSEMFALEAAAKRDERGQYIACFLVSMALFSAVYLGMNNHEGLAGTIAVTSIGVILTAYLNSNKSKQKSNKNKSEEDLD
jgi:uncharacterized membrane protein